MIKLHGFASSNYYNVPKLAMMEKGIEFEEVLAYTGFGPNYKPEYLDRTPLGKIPALETPEGFISESRAILDYIERTHPAVTAAELGIWCGEGAGVVPVY